MTKIVKLADDTYLDGSSIMHNEKTLKEIIETNLVYSTDEVVVGEWWGKPLYRKVFNFTTDSEVYTMKVFDTEISNADIIMIDISDSYIIGTDGCIYFINSIRPSSDTAITHASHNWFRINADRRKIAYVVGSLCASSPCTLTLKYTKK